MALTKNLDNLDSRASGTSYWFSFENANRCYERNMLETVKAYRCESAKREVLLIRFCADLVVRKTSNFSYSERLNWLLSYRKEIVRSENIFTNGESVKNLFLNKWIRKQKGICPPD